MQGRLAVFAPATVRGSVAGTQGEDRAMTEDKIRYDLKAQQALRGVVREVLSEVAETGLPGEHHLYITFKTTAAGVEVSQRLKARHPSEMTIVLQHQFWNLKVGRSAFEVSLSFDDIPEHLVVPFAAIKGFFDPSVQFGLQFENPETRSAPVANRAPGQAGKSAEASSVPAAPAERKTKGQQKAPAKTETSGEGAEVVQLDTFRKKS